MEITYSYMTEADIAGVADMEKKYFSQPWSEKGIAHYLEGGSTLFVVAKDEERLVGYIAVFCVLDEGNIVSFAVDEDYRRLGIATELLEIAEEESEKAGVMSFNLEVRKSNSPAISFYLQAGFEQAGERKGFYEKPKEDALILIKRVGKGF